MEVILKQDIPKLGFKDDVVKVKDGYARNYLIPKGLAIMATESNLKMHREILKQRAFKEEKIKQEAQALAEKLNNVVLKVGTKASSTGKIFGSITNIQVAEAIKTQYGIEVDRKKITLAEEHIKQLGTYEATIRFHRDVTATIKFEVIAE